MKKSIVILLFVMLVGCTEQQAEEFAFRKTLEYLLIDLCEEEKACVNAVETQLKSCLEKSDWRRYLENDEDEAEYQRFTSVLYSCIVDEEGQPYFESSE